MFAIASASGVARATSSNRAGERVGLKRVLVAYVEANFFGEPAQRFGSQMRHGRSARVEGNLDFDRLVVPKIFTRWKGRSVCRR